MTDTLRLPPYTRPALDKDFIPAVLWRRAYAKQCTPGNSETLNLLFLRPDGSGSRYSCTVLRDTRSSVANQQTHLFLERLVKFLMWQQGFNTIVLDSRADLVAHLKQVYCSTGQRSFDHAFFSERFFDTPLEFKMLSMDAWPKIRHESAPVGGHLDGCRIGFDLGGSDRKCAAVVDGEVIFSEEIEWDPYLQPDPQYHIEGIRESLKRAASKLPRVQAIGGSAAGVYMNNVPRVASLFRGIPEQAFKEIIQPFFSNLEEEWKVPVRILNDGEVTALAGSMWLKRNNLLGMAMGTSLAAGYVDGSGNLRNWFNELAFCPIDYQEMAHVDEWSGDAGCGVQYLSQQAVGRLARASILSTDPDLPLPDTLKLVQDLLIQDNPTAKDIFSTVGTYLGYALAHYAEFIELESVLLLGRVISGPAGEVILGQARHVLNKEFPELSEKISFHQPNERLKRHGQAIAAASLPEIKR